MITARLIYRVLTLNLPVPERVLNGVSIALLAIALAYAWMVLS